MRFLNHKLFLKFLCVLSVITAVFSAVTYGQVVFNSDTATANLLIKAQCEHLSLFPSSWNYVNGEIWIIAMNVFTAPFALFMEDQVLARCFGSVLSILLSISAIFYFSKKYLKDSSYLISIPIILLFFSDYGTADPLAQSPLEMILYQAAYIDKIIWITISVMWFYDLIEDIKKSLEISGEWKFGRSRGFKVFRFAVLQLLLIGGTTRLLVEILFPLFLTVLLYFFVKNEKEKYVNFKTDVKIFIRILAIVGGITVVGMLIYLLLSSTHFTNSNSRNSLFFTSTISEMWENTISLILYHFHNFSIDGMWFITSISGAKKLVCLFTSALVFFVVPYLQYKKFNQEEDHIKFFCVFAFIHNLVLYFIMIFFAKILSRYALTSMFITIILSSRYIYVYWLKNASRTIRFLIVASFGISVLANANYIFHLSDDYSAKLDENKAVAEFLVAKNLNKGYATYWNAYKNQVYSNFKVEFGAFQIGYTPEEGEKKLAKRRWLVDNDVFDSNHGQQTFMLLTSEENEDFKDFMFQQTGEYSELYVFNGHYIYVFDHDVAENFLEINKGN